MRILISSNAPFGWSGYSTQAKSLAKCLQELGHEVLFYAWFGLETGRLNIDGITLIPRLDENTRFGVDAPIIARKFGVDLCITLQDIWPLPDDFNMHCPWLAWFPVDGEPIPPKVLAMAEKADYPVVYSEFGLKMAKQAGLEVDYIPHGIDLDTFYPISEAERQELRHEHGIPDGKFVVSMVGTNVGYPSRKGYPEALAGFAEFNRHYPNSILHIHANIRPEGRGYWLDVLARQLGIPSGAFRYIDQTEYKLGTPDNYVADLYRWSDVILHPSMGEGFGLPIAEAQACGCPVITQDCTSMSELTHNGIAIKPLQGFYTLLGHWQFVPGIDAITSALEAVYNWHPEKREQLRHNGITFFRDNYDWQILKRHWASMLDEIQDDFAIESTNGKVPA